VWYMQYTQYMTTHAVHAMHICTVAFGHHRRLPGYSLSGLWMLTQPQLMFKSGETCFLLLATRTLTEC
jgi:hypothetical protein